LTITYHRRFAPRSVKVHHRVACPMTLSKSTLCHTRWRARSWGTRQAHP